MNGPVTGILKPVNVLLPLDVVAAWPRTAINDPGMPALSVYTPIVASDAATNAVTTNPACRIVAVAGIGSWRAYRRFAVVERPLTFDAANVYIRPVTHGSAIGPAGPVAPVAPVAPVGPTDPVAPVAPVAPVGPVGPVAPAAPVAPVGPVGPVAPVAPVGPVGPVAPVAPAGPVAPVGPAGPVGPTGPSVQIGIPVSASHPMTLSPSGFIRATQPVSARISIAPGSSDI